MYWKKRYFHIADPAHGLIKLDEVKFKKAWISNIDKGVTLFLEPTDEFYNLTPPVEVKLSVKYIFSHLKPYKKQLLLMFLLLFLGSCLTLVFPFLTQNLIDKGVNAKNLNLILMTTNGFLNFYINLFKNA